MVSQLTSENVKQQKTIKLLKSNEIEMINTLNIQAFSIQSLKNKINLYLNS